METQNKQWVCHPVLDHSGQLGPEDLSSNTRTVQSRQTDDDNKPPIINNEQQLSDIQNKNGLDQFFVQQVEDAICENSRQTIVRILDDVTRLTSIEKLLLYLKLPTDMNNITDPLRQPLNPLGSRTEISQTIMWIRTHLEEDPELSLPKQEVYNEYTIHCANNKMKPLSTADFGKVMKQVYPSVRPRRLGTRGNSRYCYAGLRKRFKLEVPELPVLGDRPHATEALCTQNELTTAACTIICDWAESILGTRFQSVYILASYLVRHAPQNANINSGAAAILMEYSEGMHSKDSISQELLPYSNHVNLKHKEAQLHLQRKLQQREFKRKLQLQSPKTEAKSKIKKSKLHGGAPQRTVSLDSADIESSKSQGYQLNIVCDKEINETVSNVSTLPDFSSFHLKKPINETEHIITNNDNNNKSIVVKKDPLLPLVEKIIIKKAQPSSTTSTCTSTSRSNSLENDIYEKSRSPTLPSVGGDIKELKPNFAGKLPIPRLPNKMKNIMPSPKTGVILQAPKKGARGGGATSQKYKTIQQKPSKSQENSQEPSLESIDDSLKNTDYLTRERLISVSQVDKDALDDYLHGGSNSQEQEEELMQYFKQNPNHNNNNNNSNQESFNTTSTQQQIQLNSTIDHHDDLSNGSKSDKLSQLRLLLEQNLNQNQQQQQQNNENNVSSSTIQNEQIIQTSKNIMGLNINTAGPSAFTKSEKSMYHSSLITQMNQTHITGGTKRRVSFEVSAMDNETVVPPSPNTRRKNFSFTPISPGPHSPGGGRQSKCNSTNASPFVSPRNTPVPRAKLHIQPTTCFVANNRKQNVVKPNLKAMLKPEQLELCSDKIFSDLIEAKHFVNPTDIMPKGNLPMSAPPSPMMPYKQHQQQQQQKSNLLQKLLDSNSKVAYMPDYDKSQQPQQPQQQQQNNLIIGSDSLSHEVSQLLIDSSIENFNPIESSYRSQSVPLHQMNSFKTLMSPCLPNNHQQTHFNFNFNNSTANNTSNNNSSVVAPPTSVPEFSDFDTLNDINTGLNNENLNQILNILETTQNNHHIDDSEVAPVPPPPPPSAAILSDQQSQESVFNFDLNTTSDEFSVSKLIRSQSIDIDMELRNMSSKYNQQPPSRSVPSTPVPYSKTKLLQLDGLNLNNNHNQRDAGGNNMPENIFNDTTFLSMKLPNTNIIEQQQQQQFPSHLGFTITEPTATTMLINDNKINFTRNSVENYGARRNLNTLLEQQLEEDYSPVVPRVNSGS